MCLITHRPFRKCLDRHRQNHPWNQYSKRQVIISHEFAANSATYIISNIHACVCGTYLHPEIHMATLVIMFMPYVCALVCVLQVEDAWKSTEFVVLSHRDSKDIFILGGTDDIQVLLDDSQVHIRGSLCSHTCCTGMQKQNTFHYKFACFFRLKSATTENN